jgi:hypothetical protein
MDFIQTAALLVTSRPDRPDLRRHFFVQSDTENLCDRSVIFWDQKQRRLAGAGPENPDAIRLRA